MKPMLACSTQPDVETLDYPMYASIKLDGIRCLAIEGKAYSRNMKLIPNEFVQQYFRENDLDGMDGELLVSGDFNNVQSAIMSVSGSPDFEYLVFDSTKDPNKFFSSRIEQLIDMDQAGYLRHASRVKLVEQHPVKSADDVRELYDQSIKDGYEGLVLRHPDGKYKFGRSTLKQQWMLKLKPVEDAEAKVVGVTQLLRNMDTSTKCKDNMVPVPMLGALVVEAFGVQFEIGTGFNEKQRREYWSYRGGLIGKYVTFKYQELSRYGVPRFPVFKGFRSQGDM